MSKKNKMATFKDKMYQLQRQEELKQPLPQKGSQFTLGTQNHFMFEGQPPAPLSVAPTQQPNTPMELVDLESNMNLPQDILRR